MKKLLLVFMMLFCIASLVGCNDKGQDYFNADVLEINDSYILVECLETTSGVISSGTEVEVSTEVVNANGIPEIAVGDSIRVVFTGVLETDPPRLQNVFAIYLLDENEEVIPLE